MKALSTTFLSELNENSKDFIPKGPTGTNFSPIGRSSERYNRCYEEQTVNILKFLQKICFKEQIASKSKDDFLKNSKNDRHL